MLDLTLKSGLRITVEKLVLLRTYAGLLEGLPTTKFNDTWLSEYLPQIAERHLGTDQVNVIQPQRRKQLRGGKIGELLPPILVLALVSTRDPRGEQSNAAMAWFLDSVGELAGTGLPSPLLRVDWGCVDVLPVEDL